MKEASINKLKTFKTAFGENCDVFSNSSYEVVPRIKEDKLFEKNEPQIPNVNQQNGENFVNLEQITRLILKFNSY